MAELSPSPVTGAPPRTGVAAALFLVATAVSLPTFTGAVCPSRSWRWRVVSAGCSAQRALAVPSRKQVAWFRPMRTGATTAVTQSARRIDAGLSAAARLPDNKAALDGNLAGERGDIDRSLGQHASTTLRLAR